MEKLFLHLFGKNSASRHTEIMMGRATGEEAWRQFNRPGKKESPVIRLSQKLGLGMSFMDNWTSVRQWPCGRRNTNGPALI